MNYLRIQCFVKCCSTNANVVRLEGSSIFEKTIYDDKYEYLK